MSAATKRALVRWAHILLGVPVIGYVYTPFEALPDFAHLVRYIYLPALVLAGLWMWKGHAIKRILTGRTA
ncbi:hypothetical protein [Massilia sp. erpn]|uniref:hypothetical protein n=1 Tax=Massilia sp. erpn TaxID=2738142 RepID=UPI0021037DB5|nr:hypothetical protein [Massilia sp. erpn]UTY59496.1 hypothetical protein HPQ68_21360 [Massilia sp. erpn]